MADENVTASENTTETNEQAATPATQASKPAVPSPAAMKPHAPSPAAFAKKAPQRPATSTGFSEADIKATEAFGRVADDGTVFVKEGEGEREVGQFPDASKEEALALYARRYLDLKAKLDLFANRLKSSNVKNREIDESIKTLSAEIEQPAVVGDIEALKSQFEALKEAGAAKKAELSEAHKAAVAKALAERTAIVEKAEALANSLGDNTNWRSTADKFRNLFDEWQNHQRTTVRIDKLRGNPARDGQLMADWKRLAQPFEREWLAKAKAGVTDPQLEEFRWLLEELRVGLFAQELKTPMPVSVKRLQKIWDSRPR